MGEKGQVRTSNIETEHMNLLMNSSLQGIPSSSIGAVPNIDSFSGEDELQNQDLQNTNENNSKARQILNDIEKGMSDSDITNNIK